MIRHAFYKCFQVLKEVRFSIFNMTTLEEIDISWGHLYQQKQNTFRKCVCPSQNKTWLLLFGDYGGKN